MEGRWTIHVDETGKQRWHAISGEGKPVPVVPCDDAAIERGAQRVREIGAASATFVASEVLRAAGETP